MCIMDKFDFLKEICSVKNPKLPRRYYVLRIITDLGVYWKEDILNRELTEGKEKQPEFLLLREEKKIKNAVFIC